MTTVTDYTKAPAQIVIDLINACNPQLAVPLTTALFAFGLPQAAPGTTPAKNTQVVISPVEGSGYTDSVPLLYNRVQLGDWPNASAASFPLGNATKVSDFISEINALFKVNLDPTDWVDGTLPTFAGTANESHTCQLIANPNSLVYIGALTFTITGSAISLASIITNTTLDGLYVPAS